MKFPWYELLIKGDRYPKPGRTERAGVSPEINYTRQLNTTQLACCATIDSMDIRWNSPSEKSSPICYTNSSHIQSPAQVYNGNNRKQEFIQFSESCTFAIFNTPLGESSEHVYIVERYTYGKINYRFDEKSTCYIITSLR